MRPSLEPYCDSQKEVLVWKHHRAEHFLNGTAPIEDNGVARGATVYLSLRAFEAFHTDDKYWVCPVVLKLCELADVEFGLATSLVTRNGIGPFASIGHWKTTALNFPGFAGKVRDFYGNLY